MDDLDAKIALMERLQIRCPKCGGAEFELLLPVWEYHEARSNLDGTISYGSFTGDAVEIPADIAPRRILMCDGQDCDGELDIGPEVSCRPGLHGSPINPIMPQPVPRSSELRGTPRQRDKSLVDAGVADSGTIG